MDQRHQAFADAIKALFDQYESGRDFRPSKKGHGKRRKTIHAAIRFARMGANNAATAYAVYAGLPREQLNSIQTLIYG